MSKALNILVAKWLALRPGATEGTVLRPSVLLPKMQPVEFRVRERPVRDVSSIA